jgi:arylamine N-acetyltransferase
MLNPASHPQGKAGTVIAAAPELVGRYLALLGVPRREPSLEALSELVAAHLSRIPFENLSKLYHRKRQGLTGVQTLPLFLEGAERVHFGGTCYSNNGHLHTLLVSLGYEARLCGADMREPDAHLVIMVALEGREFLVDVGYAAPFLDPMPRDSSNDYVISRGRDRYVLRPQDAHGCSKLDLFRSGRLAHGYRAKPASREIEEFARVIADSFRPTATFVNAVLITRFERDHAVVIHNLEVVESRGARVKATALANREDLAVAIEDYFGIPREITADAISEVGFLEDAWS